MSKADISSFSPLSDKVSPVQLTCFKIMSSNNSRDSDCQFLICPANSLENSGIFLYSTIEIMDEFFAWTLSQLTEHCKKIFPSLRKIEAEQVSILLQ